MHDECTSKLKVPPAPQRPTPGSQSRLGATRGQRARPPPSATQPPAPKRAKIAEASVAPPNKKTQNSFQAFVAERRDEITTAFKKEGVESSILMTLVSKRAGDMWKGLSEKAKKPYSDKAESALKVWTKEMEVFKAANPDFQKVKKLKRGAVEKPPQRPVSPYQM